MKINWIKLAGVVLACEAAGLLGSVFTFSQIPTWYAALNQPSFNPPSWVFGPVWTTLYALMGIALYLVWEKGIKNLKVREAVIFFAVQLTLNVAWSVIFFGLHNIPAALAEIVILWAFILATTIKFFRISRAAGWLMVPYLAWSTFATLLTYSYSILN